MFGLVLLEHSFSVIKWCGRDNDDRDILKCLLEGCAVLYILSSLVPTTSLIGDIR